MIPAAHRYLDEGSVLHAWGGVLACCGQDVDDGHVVDCDLFDPPEWRSVQPRGAASPDRFDDEGHDPLIDREYDLFSEPIH